MVRKITNGPMRSKERTKANLVKAVGKILKKDGFSGINAARVAGMANVDRKLIYDYYGSLSGLIKHYLESHDYWDIGSDNIEGLVENSSLDNGKALAYSVLEHQFDSLIGNEEMRRIITWGISEKLPALNELDLKRENTGDEILKSIFDPYFNGTGKNFRAIYGIMMGGVYYLTLHAKMQENPFCGIDLQEASGQQEIKKALKHIIELIYQN